MGKRSRKRGGGADVAASPTTRAERDAARQRGATMIVGGMALASLAGLELSIREHFAGFRSHTTLLAGAVGFAALALTFWLTRDRVVMLLIAATVFLGAFLVL